MHVKAKQVAFLGLLAAMVFILIILASLIEINTLFLLAAAAFLVGIAIREFGLSMGSAFFATCVFLGFLLAPNKLYVFTFTGFSFYIVFNEAIYLLLMKRNSKNQKQLFFIYKLAFFNLLYIPLLLYAPQLLFPGGIRGNLLLIFVGVGEIGWFIYDKAYEYFQAVIWGKFRNRISLLH